MPGKADISIIQALKELQKTAHVEDWQSRWSDKHAVTSGDGSWCWVVKEEMKLFAVKVFFHNGNVKVQKINALSAEDIIAYAAYQWQSTVAKVEPEEIGPYDETCRTIPPKKEKP
jgi:hypothetical protein